MGIHNDTCGCAECGNYGQSYNHGAIHNQSCGCEACGNYGPITDARSTAVSAPVPAKPRPAASPTPAPTPGRSAPGLPTDSSAVEVAPTEKRAGSVRRKVLGVAQQEVEMVAVPVGLVDEVLAFILSRQNA